MSGLCFCGNPLLPHPVQCVLCENDLCTNCSIFSDVALCLFCRENQPDMNPHCDKCKNVYVYENRLQCKECGGLFCKQECKALHLPCHSCSQDKCNRLCAFRCNFCIRAMCGDHRISNESTMFREACPRCANNLGKRRKRFTGLKSFYCGFCYENHFTLSMKKCGHKDCNRSVCPKKTNHVGSIFPMCDIHYSNYGLCALCHLKFPHYMGKYVKERYTCEICYFKVQSFTDCLILKGISKDLINYLINFHLL